TVAANDGERSRKPRAKHRAAQGDPATNSRRQCKRHCGAQGEPGGDKTRAREGFRAEPVQDVTAPDTADCDLAQARADGSVAARESAASNREGVDLRRLLVAAEAVMIKVLSRNNALMRGRIACLCEIDDRSTTHFLLHRPWVLLPEQATVGPSDALKTPGK